MRRFIPGFLRRRIAHLWDRPFPLSCHAENAMWAHDPGGDWTLRREAEGKGGPHYCPDGAKTDVGCWCGKFRPEKPMAGEPPFRGRHDMALMVLLAHAALAALAWLLADPGRDGELARPLALAVLIGISPWAAGTAVGFWFFGG